jgi:hypothetical protein
LRTLNRAIGWGGGAGDLGEQFVAVVDAEGVVSGLDGDRAAARLAASLTAPAPAARSSADTTTPGVHRGPAGAGRFGVRILGSHAAAGWAALR